MTELQDIPTSSGSLDTRPAPRRRKRTGLRIGVSIAAIAIVGFGVWYAVGRSSSSSGGSAAKGAIPVRISLQGLTTLGGALTQPIYWAGSQAGTKYELTKAKDGRVWIRYLPASAKIGEQGTRYLTIGTYPVTNAFAATQAVAKSAVRIPVGNGAVAFYRSARPTNVYVAYRGSDYQVEVFAPSARVAHALVASGKIQLIPGSTAASTHASSTGAVALTHQELVVRAKGAGVPIYWTGVKSGMSYEFHTNAGRAQLYQVSAGGSSRGHEHALSDDRVVPAGQCSCSYEGSGSRQGRCHNRDPRRVRVLQDEQPHECPHRLSGQERADRALRPLGRAGAQDRRIRGHRPRSLTQAPPGQATAPTPLSTRAAISTNRISGATPYRPVTRSVSSGEKNARAASSDSQT